MRISYGSPTRESGVRTTSRQRQKVAVALLLAAAAFLAPGSARARPPASAAEESLEEVRARVAAAMQGLPAVYQQWIRSVAGLISPAELDYFLSLRQDYRRDAFMEAFWQPRDPDPLTPVNELRRRWQQYRDANGNIPFGDPRFLAYLLNGPPGRYSLPDGRQVGRCFSKSWELEIWFYNGSERTSRRFIFVFTKPSRSRPYEVWTPGSPLRPTARRGGLPTRDIGLLCADELLRYANREISRIANYDRLVDELLQPPQPSPEWLSTFTASTTELPDGAETFEVDLVVSHPSRNQSRTAVQVMLSVPRAEAPGRRFDGELSHNFLIRGEVIRNGRLFDSFSYTFEGPTDEVAASIPLGFTRFLRPGPIELSVLLEDVYGGRYSQIQRVIEVPSPEGLPSAPTPSLASLSGTGSDADYSLRLLSPSGSLLVGLVRFNTRAHGDFDRVAFFLDEKQVISKRRAPYSVEINLGSEPAAHRVRAVGFVGDREVATDQLWLNQGAQRFRVRVIEPRPGGIYPGSLTARADIETPDGQPPLRLEWWVNDERIASLEQPPFDQALRLPDSTVAVVRAIGFLADGSTAEDAVLVNASGFLEEIQVQLVEVYALVVDSEGKPVSGIEESRFRIFEDDTEQTIRRFSETAEADLHAALLVDRSASMELYLNRVSEAALHFAQRALLRPHDRVAVLSFAEQLTVGQDFTASAAQVDRALAGLIATGTTALYDSLAQALNYFEGTSGQRALLVFSDGLDENSLLTLEQTIATARRSGVTVYVIGLEETFLDRDTRRALERLAQETGGAAHFLTTLDRLDDAYDEILHELRSRYLIAYQSTSAKPAGEPRQLRVEVEGEDLEVRSRRSFLP